MKQSLTPSQPSSHWALWLAVAGLLLVVIATAMPLLRIASPAMKWIYAAGAVAVAVGRGCNPAPKGSGLRVRRLFRLEMWAGILFCVGAFCLCYPKAGAMDYMAFTLAGGVIEVYASLMLPRAAKADAKQK